MNTSPKFPISEKCVFGKIIGVRTYLCTDPFMLLYNRKAEWQKIYNIFSFESAILNDLKAVAVIDMPENSPTPVSYQVMIFCI